jgi:hypothetical protein
MLNLEEDLRNLGLRILKGVLVSGPLEAPQWPVYSFGQKDGGFRQQQPWSRLPMLPTQPEVLGNGDQPK